MFARTIRLNAIFMLATSATVFYLGCGDDDDGNPTPSNKGGASGTTGGAGNKGGSGGSTAGKGGGSATGGDGTGGTGDGGAPTTGGTGDGGTPAEGGSAGAAQGGGGAGGTPSEGGSAGDTGGAGGAAGGTALPDCVAGELSVDECYENCTPTTSEEIMNRCSEGVECTPFDNKTLTKLLPNGGLPTPIP